MNTDTLRKKHPQLLYKSFKIQLRGSDLTISSNFILAPDITFFPQVTLHGVTPSQLRTIPRAELNLYAFNLGMAEICSYWKCAIPPEIIIEAGPLSRGQIDFWQNLLIKGMGEFFFLNQIDFTPKNFVKFNTNYCSTLEEKTSAATIPAPKLKGTLIPLGGGKDSLVTLELLKSNSQNHSCSHSNQPPPQDPITLFALNPTEAVKKTLKLNPNLPIITASRKIDPQLLKLNQAGYLNGHTPFSSYLAVLTSFTARLFKLKYIAISNERSSNERSAEYKNQPINHQYSKSYHFEKRFQDYIAASFPTPQPLYFSFLRPLYELQIAQIFAKKNLYFNEFKSCNRNQKLDSWCRNCSKCLFTYLILFPFLDAKKMTDIFKINLFSNRSLWDITRQLIGYSNHKPLDCVGTHEESLIALYLSYQKVKQNNKRLSIILEKFAKEILPTEKNLDQRVRKILRAWNKEHSLPLQFAKILHNTVKSAVRLAPKKTNHLHHMFNSILSQFENKKILIVGLAREGLSTTEFLLKNIKNAQIRIIDSKNLDNLDKKWISLLRENDNLEVINDTQLKKEKFDFIFRAPGIHPHILQKKYRPNSEAIITSNTQLFFDLINSLKTKPLIIGVSGTKGKSTTTSLTHHLLQKNSAAISWHGLNNPQVYLGGNIGLPPLRLLGNNPRPQRDIFVLELSSHQLVDLKNSPQIAIIQDISPDHLDYYAGFEEYTAAKSTLSRHQLKSDLIIYNADSETATKIARLSPGKKIPFSLTDANLIKLIKSAPSPLIGKHNLYNTLPGVIIAQYLGISDSAIKTALTTFKSIPHRLELVKTIRGVKFYNDSAASAPEAAIAGIKALKNSPIVLIVGGSDKGVSFEGLAQTILHSTIKFIVFFPTTGEKILTAMRQLDAHHPLINNNQFAFSMKEAVKIATQHARVGDVVLLSPACASFNMFHSYEDRGNQFSRSVLVGKLAYKDRP